MIIRFGVTRQAGSGSASIRRPVGEILLLTGRCHVG
jgi:hypothetical protein